MSSNTRPKAELIKQDEVSKISKEKAKKEDTVAMTIDSNYEQIIKLSNKKDETEENKRKAVSLNKNKSKKIKVDALTKAKANKDTKSNNTPDILRSFNDLTIFNGTAGFVKKRLEDGADPNYIPQENNEYKYPLLSYVIVSNHSELLTIFKILLDDIRTDVNLKNSHGYTPLMFACQLGVDDKVGAQLISLLLKHDKIQINQRNHDGDTVLHIACEYGKSECVKALIDDDRTLVNEPSLFGATPLFISVGKGDLETVKVLLKSPKINPNKRAKQKKPIELARELGFDDIVQELLKHEKIDASIHNKEQNKEQIKEQNKAITTEIDGNEITIKIHLKINLDN